MICCNKCGKEMELSDGTKFEGINFELNWAEGKDEKHLQFYRRQLGKYAPKEGVSVEYHFCFECWLDSLFRRVHGYKQNPHQDVRGGI